MLYFFIGFLLLFFLSVYKVSMTYSSLKQPDYIDYAHYLKNTLIDQCIRMYVLFLIQIIHFVFLLSNEILTFRALMIMDALLVFNAVLLIKINEDTQSSLDV